jgi:folate-binding protein YgfZ
MGTATRGGAGYEAARERAAFVKRTDRRILRAAGREPGEMLNGVLSNRLPEPLSGAGEPREGTVLYSAVLTNKGKMVTDLRVSRDPGGGFLMDLPAAGAEGALAHFKRFLPPRLVEVEDQSQELSVVTVVGPAGPTCLSKVWSDLGLEMSVDEVAGLTEGDERVWRLPDGGNVAVLAHGDLGPDQRDLIVPEALVSKLLEGLRAGGADPLSDSAREILRVEAGRPVFGRDMDERTIPVEAGIHRRAIDDGKGCYVGQEVIIRIRDRGHVNRRLRGLLMGGGPVPESGTELYREDREKAVGWVTTALYSPRLRENAGFGYVRRGVEGQEVIRLGAPDGPAVRIRTLGDQGWVLD